MNYFDFARSRSLRNKILYVRSTGIFISGPCGVDTFLLNFFYNFYIEAKMKIPVFEVKRISLQRKW